MAQNEAGPCFFLTLPLEIRHKVYGFASQRRKPKLILKEYLEKTDPNVGPPQPVAPPAAPVAQAAANDEDEGGEQEGEGGEDDTEEPETQDEDEDAAMEDPNAEEDEQEVSADVSNTAAVATAQAPAAPITDNDEDSEAEDDAEDEDGEGEGEDEDDDEEDEDEDNLPAPPPAREHSYGRQTKYRHMLKTIKIRGCPPPIGLLQVNKQIHQEATEYHRATSLMEIDITKNFCHQSFFEETLEKFINNAFSPVEGIRKAHITLTWDSEWLREKTEPGPDRELEDGWAFEHFLNERITKTISLFQGAPELRHVVVHWYDTERTTESELLMSKILMEFLALEAKQWTDDSTNPPTQKNLDVTFLEHISEAGTAHAANSLLACRRTEFDQLLAASMHFR